ncbi:MAG: ImcF-related family protein, partial [Enterobacteriaceae bacterium]
MTRGVWKGTFNLLVLLLIAAVLLWGTSNILSYLAYRQQTQNNQHLIQAIQDTKRPLSVRLYYQQLLQGKINALLNLSREDKQWFHYISDEYDTELLNELWPMYEQSNNLLIRDDAARFLQGNLSKLLTLPQGTVLSTAEINSAYEELKAYLMMGTPEKAEPHFLSNTLVQQWKTREKITTAEWQKNAAPLLDFYSEHLPQHPQWRVRLNNQLVEQARQVLRQQILHQENSDAVYQTISQKTANQYPALTLNQLLGSNNAQLLFVTEEQIPGLFTRQAWEQSVRKQIDQAVNERRRLFDWVMQSADPNVNAELSPETFKRQLTTRYFNDFSQHWLTFLNSLRVNEVNSLHEVIEQLVLIT